MASEQLKDSAFNGDLSIRTRAYKHDLPVYRCLMVFFHDTLEDVDDAAAVFFLMVANLNHYQTIDGVPVYVEFEIYVYAVGSEKGDITSTQRNDALLAMMPMSLNLNGVNFCLIDDIGDRKFPPVCDSNIIVSIAPVHSWKPSESKEMTQETTSAFIAHFVNGYKYLILGKMGTTVNSKNGALAVAAQLSKNAKNAAAINSATVPKFTPDIANTFGGGALTSAVYTYTAKTVFGIAAGEPGSGQLAYFHHLQGAPDHENPRETFSEKLYTGGAKYACIFTYFNIRFPGFKFTDIDIKKEHFWSDGSYKSYYTGALEFLEAQGVNINNEFMELKRKELGQSVISQTEGFAQMIGAIHRILGFDKPVHLYVSNPWTMDYMMSDPTISKAYTEFLDEMKKESARYTKMTSAYDMAAAATAVDIANRVRDITEYHGEEIHWCTTSEEACDPTALLRRMNLPC